MRYFEDNSYFTWANGNMFRYSLESWSLDGYCSQITHSSSVRDGNRAVLGQIAESSSVKVMVKVHVVATCMN